MGVAHDTLTDVNAPSIGFQGVEPSLTLDGGLTAPIVSADRCTRTPVSQPGDCCFQKERRRLTRNDNWLKVRGGGAVAVAVNTRRCKSRATR
jgi:hypothetical protein